MSYDDDNKGNIATAVAAGMAIADLSESVIAVSRPEVEPGKLKEIGDPVFAKVIPEGAKLELRDFEKYLPRPTRKRGAFQFNDASSFSAFVNREKREESYILANREEAKFKAIINGNEAGADGQPGWGDYTAAYDCPLSPEWRIWKAKNGVKMTQHDFAVFIEDNFLDIVQPAATFDPHYFNWPDGNTMLAVSRGLEAKNDVTFASSLRLDNGQVQFKYEETVNGSVQGGFVEVPQKFAIGVPIFAGTAPWQIVARLRYRIERGGLTMWFDFERLFKITERAFDEAKDEIAKATNLPIYLGTRNG